MTEPVEKEQAEKEPTRAKREPTRSEPVTYIDEDGWEITVTHINKPSDAEIVRRVIKVLERDVPEFAVEWREEEPSDDL